MEENKRFPFIYCGLGDKIVQAKADSEENGIMLLQIIGECAGGVVIEKRHVERCHIVADGLF